VAADHLLHTREVGGRVGVGQGVFYWYFESKDALVREIFEDTTKRLRLYQGVFIAGEPDPVRRIAKGIVASFEFITRNAHVLSLLDHIARGWKRRSRGPNVHVVDVARHLADAMDRGDLRRTDPLHPALAISAVVDALVRRHLAAGGDLDDVIQDALDFTLGGLLGSAPVKVAEVRAETEITPELERLRDQVGAGSNGAPAPAHRS
jgi:AcrR family transcriptional regulator